MLLIVMALCIIIITALLSIAESALISARDIDLAYFIKKDPKIKKNIIYVITHKRKHLSSILLLNTIVSIAGSSFIGALAAYQLKEMQLIIFTLLLTYFMLIFAKLIPKIIAAQHAGKILLYSAFLIRCLCKLLTPLLWLTLFWVKLIPIYKKEQVSRDRLKSIIEYYNVNGIINQDESMMVERVLNIHKYDLSDLLTECPPTYCFLADSTIEAAYEQIKKNNSKRYLVMSGNKIIGVVLYRHILRAVFNGKKNKPINSLVRPIIFLSYTTSLLEALKQFHDTGVSVAIILNRNPKNSKMITAKQIYRAAIK